MNKTIHKKLTKQQDNIHVPGEIYTRDCYQGIFAGLVFEYKTLRLSTNDLLQPRQEAIDNILKMSRNI